jgi:CubicO group peptidase (beta-lactamase class C family)
MDKNRLDRIDDMLERYVEQNKSAGMQSLVYHQGKIIHESKAGVQDIETQTPIQSDTLYRIFSMTKAITSVTLMTLLEEGVFHLDDAAEQWIPKLASLQVYREDGNHEPLDKKISIRQLLTHTAGFSYGFDPDNNPVDVPYAKIWRGRYQDYNMAELLDLILDHPLIAQPGTRWHYSIATDICGHLIEQMTGKTLAEYFKTCIFEPLGMSDTAFVIDSTKEHRLATLYGQQDEKALQVMENPANSPFIIKPGVEPSRLHSGGAGLISSAHDYLKFAQMMLNGGELNGVRILSRKTVDWMTTNHLDPALLPLSFNGVVPEAMPGYGFGLGYCINLDPVKTGTLGSAGDFGWGGLADTYCWIDPKEQLIGILMQQHIPSLFHAGRRDFRNLVYQAL